jgi:4,5-dihydroxyphthalate decarboxylase
MSEQEMTEQPRLKMAIGDYGHTRAVRSGSVPIKGIDADFIEVKPIIAAFRRMVRDLEFDICEMAPTTHMIARAGRALYRSADFPDAPFPSRRLCRPPRCQYQDTQRPRRQEGRRPRLLTTGVWTRGIFVNEYGLDSATVTWVVDDEEHVTTLKLPPNVIHAGPGQSLQSMMASGEIQAGFTGPAGVGRSGPPIANWDMNAPTGGDTGVYPELIANVEQVETDWFRRTGILPIHGLIVVKDELIGRHPWLPRALMDAFTAAKQPYLDELKRGKDDSAEDKRYRKFSTLMSDPLPYGISANRASIEALVTYALQQELIPSRPRLEDVFVQIDP